MRTPRGLVSAVLILLSVAACGDSSGSAGTATMSPAATSAAPTRTLGAPTRASEPRPAPDPGESEPPTSTSADSAGDPWTAQVRDVPAPDGLRAVSPDGVHYAAVRDSRLCLAEWSGGRPDCLLDVPPDATYLDFSTHGRFLGVLVTEGGGSTVYVLDVAGGRFSVLTEGGLSTDGGATPWRLDVSAMTWDRTGNALLLVLFPAAGATDGTIVAVPTDGGATASAPITADIAAGGPSVELADAGILFAPNIGPATGQLYWLDAAGVLGQVGTEPYSAGTVILVAVSPSGDRALICPANGPDVGDLRQVDLATGEVVKYLEDDLCHGAAYSPNGRYVAVAGPVDDATVLTVFDNESPDVMVSAVVYHTVQAVPPNVTWSADDVLTVTPADLLRDDAAVAVIELAAD